MLDRRLGLLALLACLCMALSLVLLGCGSASSSEYNEEVSAIFGKTSEELNHIFGGSSHGEHEGGEETKEISAASLEEAAEVVNKAYEELEKVKVPDGLEDLHKESLALLQSVAMSYEEQAALLEPEDHHEEEAHEESHDEEEHEEEPSESEEQEEHETDEEHPEETDSDHEDESGQDH